MTLSSSENFCILAKKYIYRSTPLKASPLMVAPLTCCHVIDMSLLLPGPLATQILRDLGARVTKVEPPGRGDWMSEWPPLKGDQSVHYQALNRGKEVVSMDLKQSEQLEQFKEMIATADVIVEGFRPGVMRRLGLDYQHLRELNPGIVLCSISGYGQSGPYSQRAGHDLNYQALSGALSLAGGNNPSNPSIQTADTAGGAYAAVMLILAALLERAQTGLGRHIDVSMSEQLLPLMTMQFAATSAAERAPLRDAEVLTGGAPCYRIYSTSDGQQIALAALEPVFWRNVVDRLDLRELLDEAYMGGNGSEKIHSQLEAVFSSKTAQEWAQVFDQTDGCFELVLNLEQVPLHPHWRERSSFIEIPAADGCKILVPKMPASLAGFDTAETAT
jgi:alpha-methylacyl-CoA racemase